MRIKRIKPNTILSYVFAFSLIYQSGSVMAAVVGDGVLFQITRASILMIPIACAVFFGKLKKYISILLSAIIVSIVPLLINYLLYPDGVFQLTYKIVILILSMILFMYFSDKNIDIRENIYKVIITLAIISLVIYIPTEILKVQVPYSIVYSGNSYRYRDYFELFFTYHYTMDFPRLSGLFWEPGCYQIYLNLALFYYVFNKKNNKSHLILLLISIFLTQSAAGYCIAAFLLAIYISHSSFFSKRSKKVLVILGLIIATVIAAAIVSRKIATTSGTYGSYTLRTADILNGLIVFAQNPIFGTGFGNESRFMLLDAYGRGSSNGLISYMYMTGLLGIVIVLFPFFINYRKVNDKFKQLIWLLLFLVFNIIEPIYNLPITAFFIGVEYLFAMKKLKVEK